MSSLPDAVQPEVQFLKMQHVNVARGDAVVLHDINLLIENGEHVAILGPNGCGKSTLIKTITCECYPIVASETSLRLLELIPKSELHIYGNCGHWVQIERSDELVDLVARFLTA